MNHSFGKEERLCSRKQIDFLHAEGARLMAFPFSVRWAWATNDMPCKVLITTSKRKFKHAVDRNRVKRLTREAYRHKKSALYDYLESNQQSLILSINYVHTQIMSYSQIEKRMERLIDMLKKDLSKHLPPCSSAD